MLKTDYVVLVDELDQEKGKCDKVKAHQMGVLHRALSIFLFHKHEILLQKRASHKYHSGNLWSNAACSHPHVEETLEQASFRILKNELRLNIPLQYLGHFIYREPVTDELIEHEYDHVFIGEISNKAHINFNKDEIESIRWITKKDLENEINNFPENFTAWFPHLWSFINSQ